MTQFNRSASVVVGEVGSAGIVIKDLRIVFKVNKNLDKEPNKAEISIYNLSQQTRNNIDGFGAKDQQFGQDVFLNAGYKDGDGEDVLFIGNITNITHKFEKPHVITVIHAQDGQKSLNSVKANISFKSGSSAKDVLNTIIKLYPVASDKLGINVDDKRYLSGFSFSGNASDAMDKVTRFLGLEWSFQNNELKFIPLDESDQSRIVLLTPKTGLIGSPEREDKQDRKSKGKSKIVKAGWKVKCLLNPKINPSGRLAIQSREIPDVQDFTIIQVDHIGDTHEMDWTTEVFVNE